MTPDEAIGRRDYRIAIEACTDTVGPSQFPIETWTPLATLWAHWAPGGGSESFTTQQLSGRASDRWTIPYRADCDPDLVDVVKVRRVRRSGRVYDIVAARPIGRLAIALDTLAKVG